MISPEIVIIPQGSFLMGSDSGPDNEKPCRRVWLDSFAIGRFAVINKEYTVYLEATKQSAPPYWRDPGFSDPNQPVVSVTWNDATAYCRWLSAQTGREFRLPTEAERERAARDGREGSLYPWGDESTSEKILVVCK